VLAPSRSSSSFSGFDPQRDWMLGGVALIGNPIFCLLVEGQNQKKGKKKFQYQDV
jgi:hypothetical protein